MALQTIIKKARRRERAQSYTLYGGSMKTFTVQTVDWQRSKNRLKKLRDRVFVCEWRIPRQTEFDNSDHQAQHVLLVDNQGNEIATGRITPEGEIGRIAVMSNHRSKEVYDTLFKALLDIAKNNALSSVTVQCELDGVEDFKDKGFYPIGSVFMDAGIPRQKMSCPVEEFSWTNVKLTH